MILGILQSHTMNILSKIKNWVQNPESISIVNVMSTILVYSLDNYMQIGAALSFFATTFIAIAVKYSSYKQDKLDRIQARELELLQIQFNLGLIKNNNNDGQV